MGQPLSFGSLFVIFHKMLILVDCHGAPQRAKRVPLQSLLYFLRKNINKGNMYFPNENCFNISKELVGILFADSLNPRFSCLSFGNEYKQRRIIS